MTLFWLSLLSLGSPSLAAAPEVSKGKASVHKATLAKVCKLPKASIKGLKRYDLKQKRAAGLLMAHATKAWPSKRGHSYYGLALFYRRDKGKLLPGRCVHLYQYRCRKAPGTSCHFSSRAVELLDLSKKKSVVDPGAGSWYEGPLPGTQSKASRPALMLQTRFEIRGKKTKKGLTSRRVTAHIHLLTLPRGARYPRLLYRDVSLELWPPILRARKKQGALGVRIQKMVFQKPRGLSPELTVLKKGIPSPYDRCSCKQLDQSRRYRLERRGFRRIHTL